MPPDLLCEIRLFRLQLSMGDANREGEKLVRKLEKNKKRKRGRFVYALAGFSWAIFMMKKNPSASMTVRTDSA